ncbi:MAG: HAMP domain-containing sensor histidine kinase [bacterium]|nr:HAMP domain-containing sensor histidine kinase [bacterium]
MNEIPDSIGKFLTEAQGPPFAREGSETGLTVEMPALNAERSEEIHKTVWRLLTVDDKLKEAGETDPKIAQICNEGVFNLSDPERVYFGKTLIISMLTQVIKILDDIATFEELKAGEFKEDDLNGVLDSLARAMNLINAACEVGRQAGRGGAMSQIIANLNHDGISGLRTPRICAEIVLSTQGEADQTPTISRLEKTLDKSTNAVKSLCQANLAIVTGKFEFKEFDVEDAVMEAGIRTRINIIKATGEDNSEAKGIRIIVEEGLQLFGHKASLQNMMQNLIKNAGNLGNNPCGKVLVKVSKKTDDTIDLSVRDFGKGFSREKILAKVIEMAQQKREDGEELSVIEKGVLDTRLVQHITDARLFGYFFQRGVTFVEGGKGLGMAIIKKTVDGHQGDIAICNHPEGGAEIKIILPNTEETDPIERQQMVRRALIAEIEAALS